MKKGLQWRFVLIAGVLILMSVYLLPSTPFFDRFPGWWQKYLPSKKINLGLDLQGGIHLVLEVEAEKAASVVMERYVTQLRDRLGSEKIGYTALDRDANDNLTITLTSSEFISRVEKILDDFPTLLKKGVTGGTTLQYAMRESEIKRIKEHAIDQALETIRNRIDQFGVAEPTIQRHGEREIIVQLPGVREPERAIELIGKTAQLEFKLVDEEKNITEALKGNIPPDDEILYQKVVNRDTKQVTDRIPYLLKNRVLMTGDVLSNAEVRIDQQFNQPYVSIGFDKTGAKLFEQITGENVKKRLAIILDNNVYSAPVIQEKIAGGQAQITGSFTMDQAHDLAIVLRAGALPAPVKIEENRTVGPSLGKDSIEKGVLSAFVGGILVVIFMVIYYRFSGLIADFCLLLNLFVLLGVMASLNATLTLPGIAGIILTVGMAVDANVLVFERIREELRLGRTMRAAVEAGFKRAFITIIDSNVTTLVGAVVLYQFGTGPIKGFAVTLTLGILASLFTQVFISRVVFDLILGQRKAVTISI
ncbi:MAG: protein translocase subunit SecD [Candidatus Tectomicrobia bacterium]|nr:protein translocase subunit SecD [Candidatus Tectomicrobia bacterium]